MPYVLVPGLAISDIIIIIIVIVDLVFVLYSAICNPFSKKCFQEWHPVPDRNILERSEIRRRQWVVGLVF